MESRSVPLSALGDGESDDFAAVAGPFSERRHLGRPLVCPEEHRLRRNADAALALAGAAVDRAREAIARAGAVAPDTARAYLREAEAIAARGDGFVAAYASALSVSAVDPAADADAAFRAERRQQSLLLTELLQLSA